MTDDWRDLSRELRYGFDDEFHLFEADPDTGLAVELRHRQSWPTSSRSASTAPTCGSP